MSELEEYAKFVQETAVFKSGVRMRNSLLMDDPVSYCDANLLGDIEYLTLGLVGEAGEVAGVVKKITRNDDGIITGEAINRLQDELSDVLWYLQGLCTAVDIDIFTLAKINMEKIGKRRDEGTIKDHSSD